MPAYLKFKLIPAGKVTTAYFNNIEFNKKEKKVALGQINYRRIWFGKFFYTSEMEL